MVRLSLLATLLATTLITASEFKWLSPPTNTTLDLSAPTVYISWEFSPGQIVGDPSPSLQLNNSQAQLFLKGPGVDYRISHQLFTGAGTTGYTWETKEFLEGAGKNMKFTEGKDYFFQAEIRPMFGDGEVDVQNSEKYAVKGAKSAARAVGEVRGRAVAVAGVFGVGLLLL